ncbi:tripartite tricarboxylate transporter TctB family protein [Gardnerella sp. 2492-Sm]|uniref:tripartite tricarboxylate transporter TctB family protein n=1 Tax=unclassified Gardnerella TaxID=2628112 RepID=UPI003D00DF3C
MANRKERRAKARQNRRGIPSQYDDTKGRARGGMIDEYALQERSRKLVERKNGEWKPSSSVTEEEERVATNTRRTESGDETMNKVRKVIGVCSWAVLLLSALAFLVIMWLPSQPIALVITVSVLFALGVFGLFFSFSNSKRNPRLDEHGTAI